MFISTPLAFLIVFYHVFNGAHVILPRSPAISPTSVALETERQRSLAGELMIRRLLDPGAERVKLVTSPGGVSIRNSTIS